MKSRQYLVWPGDNPSNLFLIKQVFDKDTAKDIPQADFPEFQTLVLGETAKWKAGQDKETKKTVDSFLKICWLLAFAVGCIFVMDVNKWVDLKIEQLTLLGVAVGLAVAPFAAKFKFLGMEWERYNPTKID